MNFLSDKLNVSSIRNVLVYIFISMFFISNIVQSYVLGLLILVVLFSTKYKEINFKKVFLNEISILMMLFFLIQLYSNIYSNGGVGNIKALETKASLFLFPFLFPLIKNDVKKYYVILAATFGILSMFIINIYYLYFTNMSETDVSFKLGFSYLHTSYIAIITCFMLHLFISEYVLNKKPIFWLYKFLIPFLFVGTIFISTSKIGYLALLFVIFFNLIIYVKRFKAYVTLFVVLILVSIAGFVAAKTTTILERFEESYEEIFHPNPDPNYVMSTGERLVAWKISSKVIQDHFWFGVGVGNEKEVLVEYYKLNGYLTNADLKLDAHQQFLQTFVGTGVIGLIILLLIFIFPLYKSILNRDFLLFGFMFIYLLFGLTESMLERQSGILFFFFFLLFLYSKINTKEKVLHLSK
jgi:O-antigen ligase